MSNCTSSGRLITYFVFVNIDTLPVFFSNFYWGTKL